MSRRILGGTLGAALLLTPVGIADASASTSHLGTTTGSLSSMAMCSGTNVHKDSNGNCVEMVEPSASTYVPRIAAATQWSRTRASNLLAGVDHFCATHSVAQIKANWRPGQSKSSQQTHWFNPNGVSGLNPARPRAALIYDGKLGGVAFTGKPLPAMGSIPRAHVHNMSMSMSSQSEMVHVYCTKNLRAAFTPNRQLGVKAGVISLRLKIRPAVTQLGPRQLGTVLTMVRNFCGAKLQPVAPVFPRKPGGPKPVLQARRTEIRHSLMIMSGHQLQQVWRQMQAYGA